MSDDNDNDNGGCMAIMFFIILGFCTYSCGEKDGKRECEKQQLRKEIEQIQDKKDKEYLLKEYKILED